MPAQSMEVYREHQIAIAAAELKKYADLDIKSAIYESCNTCGLPMRINFEGNFCVPCTISESMELYKRFLDLAKTRKLKLDGAYHVKSAYCGNYSKAETCLCWVHQLMRWESMPQFLSGQGEEDD